ncbi:unnamed protein product [Chrysoparadoxa australica]
MPNMCIGEEENRSPSHSRGITRRLISCSEVSGSLGDLGSFVGPVTALAASGQVSLSPLLVCSGIMHVASAVAFQAPIPCQLMHTITAVALVEGLSKEEIAAAGLVMGVALTLLAVTGLIVMVQGLVPRPVTRGIQLGLGLRLTLTALGPGYLGLAGTEIKWLGLDSAFTAMASCAVVLGATVVAARWPRAGRAHAPQVPAALLLFIIGLFLSLVRLVMNHHGSAWSIRLGLDLQPPIIPSAHAFVKGAADAALPQLPLTCLNSVVAVASMSQDLFPDQLAMSQPRRLALSIGLSNLVLCWFGHFPSCHGAGGLAAQYAAGARTHHSMLLLGLVKLGLGLALGPALLPLLEAFPRSLLGLLVGWGGLELAAVGAAGAGRTDRSGRLVTLLTTSGCMALGSGIGFVLGLLGYAAFVALEKGGASGDEDGLGYRSLLLGDTCCGPSLLMSRSESHAGPQQTGRTTLGS